MGKNVKEKIRAKRITLLYKQVRRIKAPTKTDWAQMDSKEHSIQRVVVEDRASYELPCDHTRYDCNILVNKAYLVPPCCLRALNHLIKFLMKLCNDFKIICEIDSGTSTYFMFKLFSPRSENHRTREYFGV